MHEHKGNAKCGVLQIGTSNNDYRSRPNSGANYHSGTISCPNSGANSGSHYYCSPNSGPHHCGGTHHCGPNFGANYHCSSYHSSADNTTRQKALPSLVVAANPNSKALTPKS